MSDSNKPDERVVYLTLKNVFMGNMAEMRKLAAIRKVIQKERRQSEVESLVSAHGLETICSTARRLLLEGIFESTMRAKIRFPEVFDVSPTQSAEREASEAEAVRCEATAISQFVPETLVRDQSAVLILRDMDTVSIETCTQKTGIDHTLYPAYVPIRSQNVLFSKVQCLLEHSCFAFAQRAMPEVLIARNWDCAEAVELNRWTTEFLARREQFAAIDLKIAKPLDDLFRSIAAIRHTAVHRLRISAKSIEQYLLDAESLLTLLGDQVNLVVVGKLRRETQSIIGELERNKHILNTKREKTQQRIAAQRTELDRLEKTLYVNMVKEDSDYQALAGANLEQAIMMVDMNSTNAICNGGMDVDTGDNDSIDDFEDSCSEILT